jgi:hypothetical protein
VKKMKTIGVFLVGVAAGWVLRSTFGSLRGMAVNAVAAGHEFADRARRFVAVEREYFEDLWAEGRSRFDDARARAADEESTKQKRKAYA